MSSVRQQFTTDLQFPPDLHCVLLLVELIMIHITLSQIVKIPNSKHFFQKFVQKFAFDKYRKLATVLKTSSDFLILYF